MKHKDMGEQKVCNHSMEWNIQAGYSYYRCSYCRFIDGKKTFQETVAEERARVRGEIERAIGLKFRVFGASGSSGNEEQDKKNAENVARMEGYNQAILELNPIISNILK